jgi:CRP-like cAMP-binding protein
MVMDSSRLAQAFWRESLIDAAMFRQWISVLGRRSARGKLAHLFCELFVRLHAVGLASDYACRLPLTQSDLADALGMSAVHINRTLQELRADRLIKFRAGQLIILAWDRLKEIAEFDPGYLHLRNDRLPS